MSNGSPWTPIVSDERRILYLEQRVRELEELVKAGYSEGFNDGYDDEARPQDVDAGWENSRAKRYIEWTRTERDGKT